MSESLETDELIFVTKPAGIATHRPSEDHLGFVEWLSQKHNHNFLVCHRLDKETSGAVVFAKSKEAAARLTELFSQRQVKKEYLFVSDKKSREESWTVTDEKAKGAQGEGCPTQEGRVFESQTNFQRLAAQNSLYLYKAIPLTGKTHQIRKHAVKSGVPILGDELYGGTSFPRLMLHSQKLSFSWNGNWHEHESQAPRLFQDLTLCEDKQRACWLTAFERRETLYPELLDKDQCVRLLHNETGDLRIDKVGPTWVMGWWQSRPPSENEIKKINHFVKSLDQKNWSFHWRPGVEQKGQLEILTESSGLAKDSWIFSEGPLRYVASLERGQNFGLFLDQRERRQWLRERSQGKRVLNLFAFTCGFSLNAAAGGAEKVVSIDSFNKYLEWGKENFRLNDVNPDDHEFRAMDSFDYLRYAAKKTLKFDFVVCDPPSFSRAKKQKKVFRVERDYAELLTACSEVLNPGGILLFSTNYEKWDFEKWQVSLATVGAELGLFQLKSSPSQWDYEWQKKQANLKAFFLKKA